MKYIVATLIVLSILVAGCVPGAAVPDYVLLLTPANAAFNGRCTGIVLDADTVLTAAHCADGDRLRGLTVYGQEVLFTRPTETVDDYDLVKLTPDHSIILLEYAEIGKPVVNLPARLVGYCPRYIATTPRFVYYQGRFVLENEPDADYWRTLSLTTDVVCGGDSGGPVIQNGKVVGMVVTVNRLSPYWVVGFNFATVPLALALEM